MNQNLITIKSLADELGISKQAITKRIKKLGFYEELETVGGRLVLTDNQKKAVIEAFSSLQVGENQQPTTNNQPITDNQKEKEATTEEEPLYNAGSKVDDDDDETDNQKKEEATTDNQQIIIESLFEQLKEKDQQIAELHQRLAEVHTLLNQQQRLLAVEQQKALPVGDAVEPEQKKKGFWAKLFGL